MKTNTEKAIMFSGALPGKILADEKTQTRRVVKGWPLDWLQPGMFTPEYVASPENKASPYGQPGDRLWVRETFWAFGRWETRFSEKKGRDEWHFVDMTLETSQTYLHQAPAGWAKPKRAGATPAWWKRPAIFMPRAACRIVLEITGVRVERLQDISDEDCIAEGCGATREAIGVPMTTPTGETIPRAMFRALWESINGPGSWDANPWLWVITFNRLKATP